jgi:hypothetical protein
MSTMNMLRKNRKTIPFTIFHSPKIPRNKPKEVRYHCD